MSDKLFLPLAVTLFGNDYLQSGKFPEVWPSLQVSRRAATSFTLDREPRKESSRITFVDWLAACRKRGVAALRLHAAWRDKAVTEKVPPNVYEPDALDWYVEAMESEPSSLWTVEFFYSWALPDIWRSEHEGLFHPTLKSAKRWPRRNDPVLPSRLAHALTSVAAFCRSNALPYRSHFEAALATLEADPASQRGFYVEFEHCKSISPEGRLLLGAVLKAMGCFSGMGGWMDSAHGDPDGYVEVNKPLHVALCEAILQAADSAIPRAVL